MNIEVARMNYYFTGILIILINITSFVVEDQVPTNKPMKISEEAAVQMPMKTVASLIAIIVAIGTMGYISVLYEKLNHSTLLQIKS